ncbi:ArsR/SmtB family transcription factor [Jongsikchunia kroppenstedtii]|uniref:ArsR/SmtB family transcription factor n=1 Tax=Jongsikchunia kroppenstedtii TaxID=1121721 RepID=UPI000378179E|nr:helix-turn-helix transcriptional regulator [Jongsikchunia kroppenstedtii]
MPAIPAIGEVLAALDDPVRLEMVRRLANAGEPVQCKFLYDGISKSTASHHFAVLREAGVTESVTVDGSVHQRLLETELERDLPGVVGAIVAAANQLSESVGT